MPFQYQSSKAVGVLTGCEVVGKQACSDYVSDYVSGFGST